MRLVGNTVLHWCIKRERRRQDREHTEQKRILRRPRSRLFRSRRSYFFNNLGSTTSGRF